VPDIMPVELIVGTEFMCRHSGVSTLEFFYDPDARAESKAQAHVDFLERFHPETAYAYGPGGHRSIGGSATSTRPVASRPSW